MMQFEFRVYGADYVRRFVEPNDSGMYGLNQLRYLGSRLPCVPGWGQPLNPGDVAALLDEMQQVIPLGILGDIEVLVTDLQFLAGDDPTAGQAQAYASPGFIALSWSMGTKTPRDVFTHEVAHLLQRLLSESSLAEFWAIVGHVPGEPADTLWERRPQEQFAEYLSAALWGMPIDSRMPSVSPDILAIVRTWAQTRFGGEQPAVVRLMTGEAPASQTGIILTPGSTRAVVDGQEYTLDVPPQIINGRTMVPVRFVAEALKRRVHWDGHRVYIS